MMDTPEISYCLPVFNSAARIERCLRGVLEQRAKSREILLVDNASTDDTVARARALLDGVPGARIIVNDRNIGRIENWSRCLELATGESIKFALANDRLLPGGADMLLKAARANPGAAMICSQQLNVDGIPENPQPADETRATLTLNRKAALLRLSERGNDTGALGGMLIRGEGVRRHNLRFRADIPYWSDFYFTIELAALGETVYLDTPSYLFDRSVKGRFAVSGTGAQTRSLCFEARECALLLAKLLPEFGVESWHGFEFLHTMYTGASWFGILPVLSKPDTQALFTGAGPLAASAERYRFWKSFGRFEHPLQRVLSKVGLYRYPWQQRP